MARGILFFKPHLALAPKLTTSLLQEGHFNHTTLLCGAPRGIQARLACILPF